MILIFLTANAKVATVLGSIPASSDTVESDGRQMKQGWITYIKSSYVLQAEDSFTVASVSDHYPEAPLLSRLSRLVPQVFCAATLRYSTRQFRLMEPVLWIRIGFNADLDPYPAFYLNADPDPYQGSQTNADLCGSGSSTDFQVTKSRNFTLKYTSSR
jgi:hypothetical protein